MGAAPVESEGSRSFRIEDPGDARRIIRGRIDAPPGAARGRAPFVVLLHGFKGFMDWGFFPLLARRLAAAGIVAVRFNTSGSGIGEDLESFTELSEFRGNTFTRELEDLERVRVLVTSGEVPEADPARAGIFGHSRGGALAILHASEAAGWRALATWAAISTVERFDEPTVREWRARGHILIRNARTGQELELGTEVLEDVERNRARLDVQAACGRIATPALLVHGTADEAVPFHEGEALRASFRAGVARFLAVNGAGHTFGAVHPLGEAGADLERVLDETVAHFERHLA